MISEKKTERLEHSVVQLTVTVPQAEIKKSYDSMMKGYVKEARVDGFRKGHVPVSVLERKYGDSLRLEAMSNVIEAAIQEAIQSGAESPLMYNAPSLEGAPDFSLDKDFTFTVKYDAFPEIAVPDWHGIQIQIPDVAVSQDDIDKEIASLRDANSIVVEKEGICSKGNIVTVDYAEIDQDGNPLEGKKRQDFAFEIGTGYNLYKFDDDIAGMTKGETRIFEKSYPETFEYSELAGKTVKLSVTLTKIKEKQLPELDDEFAQDVSEKYSTFADLLDSIKARLEKNLEERIRRIKEQRIAEALLEKTTVDLPVSMVNAELSMRWDSLKRQMGIDSDEKLEMLASQSGKPRSSMMEEWRPSVVKALSSRLLLDKLIEQGAYACTEEDLEAFLETQAIVHSMTKEELRAEYVMHNSLDSLKEQIKEDKFFADVLASATVSVGEAAAYMDIMRDNQ